MSTTNSTEDEPVAVYRKPRVNVYTVMLVISLLAILTAIVFLWLYLDEYQWKHNGGPNAALSSSAGGVFACISPQGGAYRPAGTLRPVPSCFRSELALGLTPNFFS